MSTLDDMEADARSTIDTMQMVLVLIKRIRSLEHQIDAVDKVLMGTPYGWVGKGKSRIEVITQMLKDATDENAP